MFEEVLKQLQDLIRDYTGNSELVINEDTMMVKDLELSSLDVINLMGSIEDTFDISIEDEDLANLLTVKDAVDYIISKKED